MLYPKNYINKKEKYLKEKIIYLKETFLSLIKAFKSYSSLILFLQQKFHF